MLLGNQSFHFQQRRDDNKIFKIPVMGISQGSTKAIKHLKILAQTTEKEVSAAIICLFISYGSKSSRMGTINKKIKLRLYHLTKEIAYE